MWMEDGERREGEEEWGTKKSGGEKKKKGLKWGRAARARQDRVERSRAG